MILECEWNFRGGLVIFVWILKLIFHTFLWNDDERGFLNVLEMGEFLEQTKGKGGFYEKLQ